MNTEITTTSTTLPIPVELRQQDSAPIKVWQPRVGDSLKGSFVGGRQAVGRYGVNHQILIKDKYGNVTAVWLNPWLKKHLIAQGARKGDLITLTYLGQKASKTRRYYTPNRSYNEYKLVVHKDL